VIVSDVGSLRDYFGPEHVFYVPPHDVQALQETLRIIVGNPELALQRAQAASRHFAARDYTTHQFAMQHVRITQQFIRQARFVETPVHADVHSVASSRRAH
jgi:glycosyltransferase involved in cell wall biosynthesis